MRKNFLDRVGPANPKKKSGKEEENDRYCTD